MEKKKIEELIEALRVSMAYSEESINKRVLQLQYAKSAGERLEHINVLARENAKIILGNLFIKQLIAEMMLDLANINDFNDLFHNLLLSVQSMERNHLESDVLRKGDALYWCLDTLQMVFGKEAKDVVAGYRAACRLKG